MAARTPAPSVDVYGAHEFWESALCVVATAKKTVFCTGLVYDNPKLQAKLLASRARGVSVEVLVDKLSFQEGTAKYAWRRL